MQAIYVWSFSVSNLFSMVKGKILGSETVRDDRRDNKDVSCF